MAMLNWGAGLSALGGNIATQGLEAQKAAMENDKIALADKLMAARESTGRAESHNYAMLQQGARLDAEAPERAARVRSLNTSADVASSQEARQVAAGQGVADAFGGASGSAPAAVPTDVMMRLPQIQAAAEQHGVPVALAVGMFSQENGGKATGVSPAGARGIAQLMPGTAQEVGVTNPDDPQQAIPGGVNYLGKMLKKYNGDTTLALMGYNWGPGNVDNWVKSGADPAKIPDETKTYLQRVQGYAQAFGGNKQPAASSTGSSTGEMPEYLRKGYEALSRSGIEGARAALESTQKWYEDQRRDAGALDLRKAQTENYSAETIAKKIATEAAQNVLDAKKELGAALASNDPDRINAAKVKIYAAEFSGKEESQRVSLYQTQARLIESAMASTQSKLASLQDPAKQMTPATQQLTEQLTKVLERQRGEYNAALREANEALKSLPTYSPPSAGGSGANERDLGAALGVPMPGAKAPPPAPTAQKPAAAATPTPLANMPEQGTWDESLNAPLRVPGFINRAATQWWEGVKRP